MYCWGNLYSTALLYLMAFSRYRALADPFDAIPYKEILRKVIGFGIATVVVCVAAAATVNYFTAPEADVITSKFDNLVYKFHTIQPSINLPAWSS
eukprot:sb/3479273/